MSHPRPAVGVLAATIGVGWVHTSAQTAPAFEVASIKRNASADVVMRFGGPPGRFNALNMTLTQLILRAYQIQPIQLEGGPSWISSDRFDIVAKVPASLAAPEDDSWPTRLLMLRTLLADRFRPVAHHETKEQFTRSCWRQRMGHLDHT